MIDTEQVLVTGAAGFIGSHTCEKLLNDGYHVVGIDNLNKYYNPILKEYNLSLLEAESFDFYKSDISDYEVCKSIFTKYQFSSVIHLAAQAGVRYSLENPFTYQKSNIEGTLNILELCRKSTCNHIVFASSSSVYGERSKVPFSEKDPINKPISMYAATKQAGEALCHSYNHLFNITINCLRFFTVYGPRGRPDMAPHIFLNNILSRKRIKFFDDYPSKMKRDFTFISDIVDGIVKAHNYRKGFEIFNLGYGTPTQTSDFLKAIEAITGVKAQIEYVGRQPGDVHTTYADSSKAKRLLNFHPKINYETGLKTYIEWFKEYYKIN